MQILLYKYKTYYGLFRYLSTSYCLRASRDKYVLDKIVKRETDKVHSFKKYNKFYDYLDKILYIQNYFNCDGIFAVPSSSIKKSSLQLLLNDNTFERIIEVNKRKYNHNEYIHYNSYKSTLKVNINNDYKKVLLIDDIITTGATIDFYSKLLKEYNIDCVPFCLGLNNKLDPELVLNTTIEPTKTIDDFDLNMDFNFNMDFDYHFEL